MPPKDSETAAELAALTARYEALVTDIHGQLKRITEGLWGSADDPGKGLLIRVDRLEQAEKRRDHYIKVAICAAIVAVVGSLWGLITKPTIPAPADQSHAHIAAAAK